MKILLGTNNKHKIIEMTRIIKEFESCKDIEIVTLSDFEKIAEPIEDGKSFIENATIKAKYFYNAFKIPVSLPSSPRALSIFNSSIAFFSSVIFLVLNAFKTPVSVPSKSSA